MESKPEIDTEELQQQLSFLINQPQQRGEIEWKRKNVDYLLL